MTNESTEKPNGLLWVLTVLGGLSTGWAIFLWFELITARSGGTPFCAVGKGFDCVALWDGAFASQIHSLTGIPIAGWGVAWGLVSVLTPLLAIFITTQRQTFLTATRLNGVLGLLSLMLFIGVSLGSSTFCLGCIGTYVLVSIYGGLALWAFRDEGFERLPAGASALGGLTVAAALLMIYPGQQTPVSPKTLEKEAMQALQNTAKGPAQVQATKQEAQQPAKQPKPQFWSKEEKDTRLRGFLSSLPPAMLQGIADALLEMKIAKPVPLRKSRAIIGDPNATLKLIDFTDVRCGHCAQLHETLKEIYEVVPSNSFNLEARHFPLDGNCNPDIPRKSPDAEGCLAAKAQICFEGSDQAFEFSGKLFTQGRNITKASIYQTALEYMAKDKLEACLNHPETDQKLQEDITYAKEHNIHGTPLLLFNGRKAPPLGPFIFAMILSEGNENHPAFSILPKGNINTHEQPH